ncbi:MAG: hypothetical protein V3W04_01560 [Gammaproteobacteria bacterium]
MKTQVFTLIILAVAMTTMPARAENVSVGIKAGTLGLGVELSMPLGMNNLNGRLGFNYYSDEESDTLDGVDYDADVELKTFSAMLDWHPMANGFRLTGGLFYNGNEGSIESTSVGSVDIGGTTFILGPNDKLSGDVDFNTLAPYLGIGYGQAFGHAGRLSFSVDLGVLFQGSPNVSLNAEGPLSGLPGIQAAVDQEEKNIQDDVDNFEYYPVVSLGVSYRY